MEDREAQCAKFEGRVLNLQVWACDVHDCDKTPMLKPWPQYFRTQKLCEDVRRELELGEVSEALGVGLDRKSVV